MNSMICPKCGNLISYNSYFGAYYCSVCGEYFQEIKKTNADKIRGMSDEELAKLLCCTGWKMFKYKVKTYKGFIWKYIEDIENNHEQNSDC